MSFTEIDLSDLEFFEELYSFSRRLTNRVRWKSEDKIVAVKRVTQLERREIATLNSLRHENIVQFLGVAGAMPDCFLVAEFAEQGSLYNCLTKHVMDSRKVLSWARQIALGMNYLHYHSPNPLIHKCLDSEHVVIGRDLTAKICVWGIYMVRDVNDFMAVGRPMHLSSPEFIRGEPLTPASDVLTYSGILWELLTQELPFNWLPLVGERPRIPSSCPSQFVRLMEMCWKQEQKERPNFKQILNVLDDMLDSDLLREETNTFLRNKSQWKKELSIHAGLVVQDIINRRNTNQPKSEKQETVEEETEKQIEQRHSPDQNQQLSKPLEEKSATSSASGSSTDSQKILAVADLAEVTDELCKFKKAKWKDLGRKLGLAEEVLDEVKADYKEEGVDEYLVEMLKHWLRMNYEASDSKPPTWSNLADAVKRTGDRALAKTIREHYPS